MNLLIDTNVILDVLLNREPFSREAYEVLRLAQRDDIQEYVSASAITDIYYIINRNLKDKEQTRKLLQNLLTIVSVAAVTESEIRTALEGEWPDFEDSVQHAVALHAGINRIVTRNEKDYGKARIPVLSPAMLLRQI